jgi:hypothetical protein
MQGSLGFGAQKLRAAPYGTSMSDPDDDYEFPPTASLFVLLIGGFLVWWAWELIDELL